MLARLARLGLAVLTLWPVVVLGACATLGPRTQGQNDVMTWQATDLQLEREVDGRWTYAFQLVIRNVRGTGITFTEIELAIYQPGITPYTARYRGTWRLDASDAFRIPLSSTITCPGGEGECSGSSVPIPLWQIVMHGKDDGGQPVKAAIDLSLPADPPAPSQTTSKSVRPIRLR